ncbi:MAG: isoaspartyl peptidase/L-asparaginase, partial [Pseudomonadota bacterium]
MLRPVLVALTLALTACQTPATVNAEEADVADTDTIEWRLVIHGGAGVILRENLTPEREAAYTAALETALEAGAAILRDGGSAVDAVQAAVIPMEDDPLFNAGQGAVFTAAAEHELDASIMSGADRDAGAVAGVKRV